MKKKTKVLFENQFIRDTLAESNYDLNKTRDFIKRENILFIQNHEFFKFFLSVEKDRSTDFRIKVFFFYLLTVNRT